MDWTKKYRGHSSLALRPSSAEQVAQILRYCHEQRLAVVPQGGNTGLVGGGVPIHDEIVLSLERLNRIVHHDPVAGTLTVEAGCILQVADDFLRERGFLMPLDLGAKGSCQIGGNLATNAGGLRVLRYGSLHGNVLGMQVVLPDGSLVEGLGGCRKDNAGYDWKQLFIGSEGTLGVITAATILTPPLPRSIHVALCTLPSYEAILEMYARAKEGLAEILSAFEFWDVAAQRLSEAHSASGARLPITSGPFHVLIETSGSDAEHDGDKLMRLFTRLQQDQTIIDATLAQDATQAQSLWGWREGIPEACAREGLVIKYDVSLPTPQRMYDPVLALRERLEGVPGVKAITGYGHFGDGNIHLNVAVQSPPSPAITAALEPFIYQLIRKRMQSPPPSTHGRQTGDVSDSR